MKTILLIITVRRKKRISVFKEKDRIFFLNLYVTTLDRIVVRGREQEPTVWAHAHAGDPVRVALQG